MEFWTPPRDWEGQDAHLIGGGPSLKQFNFGKLVGHKVIGCNDAFRLGPEIISYNLFGDASWWQRHRHEIEVSAVPFVTNATQVIPWNLPNVRKMERIRDGVHSGHVLGWNYSTGAAAINLAISLGAKRIFLLGYDLSNQGTVSHWHQHNGKIIQDFAFNRFINGFKCVKAHLPQGIQVYNVTDGSSKLECFDRVTFAQYDEMVRQEVLA